MTESNGRDHFKQLHRAMKAVVEAQDAAGWTSPEVERLTARVLMGLWCCANNDPIPKTILDGLREDMAALEAARR